MSGLETKAATVPIFDKTLLRRVRIEKDLTMEELGALLNVSVVTISYWESGRYQPRTKKVERLAKIFKLKPQDFYGNPAEVR